MSTNHPHSFPRRKLLGLLSILLASPVWSTSSAAQGSRGRTLKIGIIGAGNIGGTLAALWVKAGHQVMLSSRHPEHLKAMAAGLGPLARVGTPAEAAAFGDAVLVAIPYGSYPQLGQALGSSLKGKIVLDAGNPTSSRGAQLADETRKNGIGPTTARYLGNPRVVRVFSSLSSSVLEREANRPAPRLAIPIAGDDREALDVVSRLVADAGFDPVLIGGLDRAPDTAMGGVLSGVQTTADELRARLKLAK